MRRKHKRIGSIILCMCICLLMAVGISTVVKAEEYADRPVTGMDEEGNVYEIESDSGLVENEISTYANTDEKIVNFNTKGNVTTEYVEVGTNESGYTNGAFGADAAYLGETGGKVKFMLSGVVGLVDKSRVQVLNKSSVQITSYYTVSGGWLVHKVATKLTNGSAASSIRCGKAPAYLTEGGQYYSYDGNYFYAADKFGTMLNDYKNNNRNNAINSGNPYYNYYQYLPMRSKSTYSASTLDSIISGKTVSGSKMRGTGNALKNNQDSYGVNALLTAGIAANESSWGTSAYAIQRNNLFGINAVDSNPDNALSFPSADVCIKDFAETYMSKQYLNPQNWVYYGSFLGNKGSGINVKYASDPYWGEKAAAISWILDEAGGYADQDTYTIGIKDSIAGAHQDLNVRAGNNTSASVLYTTGTQSNVAFVILNKTPQNGFYQVQSDGVLNSSKTGIDNSSGKYDFSRMTAFVSADYIILVNHGDDITGGNNPGDGTSGFNRFQDVSGGWFYDYVKYVYDRGIMTGLNQTIFGPAEILSRGQFATILYRMAGEPDVSYNNVFPDVPNGAFFTLPVIWAYNNNIITGYQNGNFGPPDLATREQIAVLMYRYAQSSGLDTQDKGDINSFPDASKVSSFSKEAMQWAVGSGMIQGDQGKLNPQGRLSRAQCATIITRFMQKYNL